MPKKAKIIYFCDIPFSGTPKHDWEVRKIGLEEAGINLNTKVEITTAPPFEKHFDILFFDWGGMSIGNSIMESFCREIIELARDNPSRMFVMASDFTKDAMEDAQLALETDNSEPVNIFLDFKAFVKACKDQGLVKKGKLVWK